MKKPILFAVLFFAPSLAFSAGETSTFDAKAAERFAKLALACVGKEYPNKISHVLNGDADVAPPRKLTPAFYGCYDWHSSVHGHWLLVRLLRTFPTAPFAAQARDALRKSLTMEDLKQEAAYLRGEGRTSFERPYGLAWLLQLCAELREWDDPQAREMSANLRPLEEAAVERLKTWLPKLSHPVRIGEHDQTAFGLGLMLDYARTVGDESFAKLVSDSARKFFLTDKNCPLAYEPSGEDFLSPCLGEADVMRRVLSQKEFASWLREFLPQIRRDFSRLRIIPLPQLGAELEQPRQSIRPLKSRAARPAKISGLLFQIVRRQTLLQRFARRSRKPCIGIRSHKPNQQPVSVHGRMPVVASIE